MDMMAEKSVELEYDTEPDDTERIFCGELKHVSTQLMHRSYILYLNGLLVDMKFSAPLKTDWCFDNYMEMQLKNFKSISRKLKLIFPLPKYDVQLRRLPVIHFVLDDDEEIVGTEKLNEDDLPNIKYGYLDIHSFSIASLSPVFEKLVEYEKFKMHKMNEIDIFTLQRLIYFCYTGEILITDSQLLPLFHATDFLQIHLLNTTIREYIKHRLQMSKYTVALKLAVKINCVDMVEEIIGLCVENFSHLLEYQEFFEIEINEFEKIISSDSLAVKCEYEVVNVVLRWIEFDESKRSMYTLRLFRKLHLSMLSANELVKLANTSLIHRNLTCRDIIDCILAQCLAGNSIDNVRIEIVEIVNEIMALKPRLFNIGTIFCIGGRGASGNPCSLVEAFDFRKDQWCQIAELANQRRHVGLAASQGTVYAIGGHDSQTHMDSVERYDIERGCWEVMKSMSKRRRGIAAVCIDRHVYAIGGLDDHNCYDLVEKYDTRTNTWSTVAPLQRHRGGVAAVVHNNMIYAVGGNDGTQTLSSCEVYVPIINRWTYISSMTYRRAGAALVVLNNFLYVIGGFDDQSPTATCEKFHLGEDKWSMIASMKTKRGGVGAAVLNERIYAIGGHDGNEYLNSVESYDIYKNEWRNECCLNESRAGAGIVAWNCPFSSLKIKL